ncbi:MAG: mogA [Betaproteobacteria bacterium]|jgi:molybdopterin adenylyltransferase|nr:mogA [Betaproteobacteria bacterium]
MIRDAASRLSFAPSRYILVAMSTDEQLFIGLVSISDRASQGVYKDEGIPALEEWFKRVLTSPSWRTIKRLIPDEQPLIETTLKELVDDEGCHLVFTTGGTGPAARDVTPEATMAVADKEMPGFGEQMRQVSLKFVPTAILSRQVAVIRKQALIINLPGQPKAIKETLEGLKDENGKTLMSGIFAAVPYCVDLIGGPYIETNEDVVKAFRPKSALRPKS